MGFEQRASHRHIPFVPFGLTDTSIAAKTLYRLGPDGDIDPGSRFAGDPGNVLVDAVFKNTGTVDLQVANSPVEMLIGDALGVVHYTLVPAGEAIELVGERGEMCVYNPEAADAGSYTIDSLLGRRTNRSAVNRAPAFTVIDGHPGHDPELSARVIGQANGVASVTLTVPKGTGDGFTIAAIELLAQTKPASAGGTYLLTVTGAGNNLLVAATFDLETLTAVTVETLVLTGTAADLNLDPGDSVVITATSNNEDLATADFFAGFTLTAQ